MISRESQEILAAARAAVKHHLTREEFFAELARGSQVHIDLDPRIDLTAPIYEQALRLAALDEGAERDAGAHEDVTATA